MNLNPFDRERLTQEILDEWQGLLDEIASIFGVPAALITRLNGPEFEIFLSSASEGNPYEAGYKAPYPNSGFYCEWVVKNRKAMSIPDARKDPMWSDNPAVEMNMVSYLGMPIQRPDGEIFGTICLLDKKENPHNDRYIRLLERFKRVFELSLEVVHVRDKYNRDEQLIEELSKIFPICSYCKKVRHTSEEWTPIENYILSISGRNFTHSVCPECYKREIESIR